MSEDIKDLIVIGGGPGGYVAAIRAAQLGMEVALVEKNQRLGGTCLNVGCIPSKALLESSEFLYKLNSQASEHGIRTGPVEVDLALVHKRKESIVRELTEGIALLIKRHKITLLTGEGEWIKPGMVRVQTGDGDHVLTGRNILMATGSLPVELPFLPFDGKRIISSTEALSLSRAPGRLAVIGAGAVGLELGCVWARMGSDVTVIEMLPSIAPFADRMLSRSLEKSLENQGIRCYTGCRVTSADVKSRSVSLAIENAKKTTENLTFDKVLVAVGRKPNTKSAGIEKAGIKLDEHGFVMTDESYATNIDHVLAIGDLIGHPMLAHKASEEGVAVVEKIAGLPGHVNYQVIPNIVYTDPELAMVGITEEEAKSGNIPVSIGRFFFGGNGRAKSLGQQDGFVKIIAHRETDRLLGAHILGPRASELIHELAMAMEFGGSSEDVARTVHAHPTLSEAIKEAALAVDNRAIHR